MNPFAFLSVPGPLVALLLVLAWGGAGYWAGDHNRNNAWLAKQAVAERDARLALQAEVARGNQAQMSFTAEYLAMESSFTKLEGKFNDLRTRVPLAVYRKPAPAQTPAAPGEVPGGEPTSAVVPGVGGAPAPPLAAPGADAGPAVGLSLGAVWLWNSALTGTSTPAGACGATDAPNTACAADSGLGLEAAWANHATNAKACALDRLRHQRLIDYLTASTPQNNTPLKP